MCCRPPQCRLRVGRVAVAGQTDAKDYLVAQSRGSRTFGNAAGLRICYLILVDEGTKFALWRLVSMAQLTGTGGTAADTAS